MTDNDPQTPEESGENDQPTEEVEDLELEDDEEITERVRGGARRTSIPY